MCGSVRLLHGQVEGAHGLRQLGDRTCIRQVGNRMCDGPEVKRIGMAWTKIVRHSSTLYIPSRIGNPSGSSKPNCQSEESAVRREFIPFSLRVQIPHTFGVGWSWGVRISDLPHPFCFWSTEFRALKKLPSGLNTELPKFSP